MWIIRAKRLHYLLAEAVRLLPNHEKLSLAIYDAKRRTADHICMMMGITKPDLYKYIEAQRKAKSKLQVSVQMPPLVQ